MEPYRYKAAYTAMYHTCHLLEERMRQNDRAAPEGSTAGEDDGGESVLEQDDGPMEMDWTPTETVSPPVRCGPPPTTASTLAHLLPDGGQGEYRVEDQGPNGVLLHKLKEGALLDECIDKLVRDFPEVMSYGDATNYTPSTIEVPKDFGLQLSISINHHLAHVEEQKHVEKCRRLLGLKKDPATRKIKLGFDPADMIKKQAVTFPKESPIHVSTLDNEIHPIFRLANFHGCPNAIYEVLKPALRLATLLLFSRATSHFWHTLVFGNRTPCPQTSEQYGQPCSRIRGEVSWSEEQAAAFRSFIDEQVDTVYFYFHRDPLPPDRAYASMGLVSDYKSGLMRKLTRKCATSRICLHADFFTTAKKLSQLQWPDSAMVLRFNLFLAVCLAHEMAHFIEVSGPHHERLLSQAEVFWNDNTWTESGVVFELKVFGARLHPISSRIDCLLGLAVLSYPLKLLHEKEENILYTLPMDYVSRIQQKETWEQDFSKLGSNVFHVPRTGSRSIEVNGTNLMVWADESDADISDHIDQKDTLFKRMNDGQIIKNPTSNNRKATRHPEHKRFSPYARVKKVGSNGLAALTSPEKPERSCEVQSGAKDGDEAEQQLEGEGAADDDML